MLNNPCKIQKIRVTLQAKKLIVPTMTGEEYLQLEKDSLAKIDYSKVDWEWEKKHHEQMHAALENS